MNKHLLFIAVLICCTAQTVNANINAIDFKIINYPKAQQANIDFLFKNQAIYNRWVHTWNSKIPKAEVVEHLTTLYAALDALTQKNTDVNLLIGDIAHYLYNMEIEEYYKKAIDHYEAAKKLSPEDYRVYWFLGNHYALSAEVIKSIENYKMAVKYQPTPMAHPLFWAEYAISCSNASMPATALYAAEKSSSIEGDKSYIENQLAMFKKGILHAPPIDTTINTRDMWFNYGNDKSNKLYTNWALGTKLSIDSTWIVHPNDYKGGQSYTIITPPRITAKSGQKIGFNILIFTRAAKPDQSLNQFMDIFTAKYAGRKSISLNVGQIKNCIAYEIIDPEMYKQIGGGHSYAVAFERNKPAYPGMVLEEPVELPKSSSTKLNYYSSLRKFSRLNGKLYYLLLLDSCEFIHDESLAKFTDFITNGIIIE